MSTTIYTLDGNRDLFRFYSSISFSDPGFYGGYRLEYGAAPDGRDAGNNYDIEFETEDGVTEVQATGYDGAHLLVSVDGQASTQINGPGDGSQTWTIATGLSAGRHLIRVSKDQNNCYIRGFNTVDGTLVSHGGGRDLYYIGDSKVLTAGAVTGGVTLGVYNSFRFAFSFVGTGVDILGTADNGEYAAVSVDGAPAKLFPVGFDSFSNSYGLIRAVDGLAPGTHTVVGHYVQGANGNARTVFGVRPFSAQVLTAPAAAGATTLTLSRLQNIVSGEWLKVGTYDSLEFAQVASVAGSTVTLTAALTKSHASGASVHAPSDAAGVLNAAPDPASVGFPTADKLIVGMGDSNTQGANPYGGINGPDGVQYVGYDSRRSFIYLAGQSLGWDSVNVAVQGTDTGNQAGRAGDIGAYANGRLIDWVTMLEGTNDANSNSQSPASVLAYLRAQVDAAAPYLKAGGKILLIPPKTPIAPPTGLTIADVAAQMQTVANDTSAFGGTGVYAGQPYSSFVVYASHAWDGVNLTAYNASSNPTGMVDGNLHLTWAGQQKLADNLRANYFNPVVLPAPPQIGVIQAGTITTTQIGLFVAQPTGTGPLTEQWFRQPAGSSVTASTLYQPGNALAGATGLTLTDTPPDGGSYTYGCQVTDGSGQTAQTALYTAQRMAPVAGGGELTATDITNIALAVRQEMDANSLRLAGLHTDIASVQADETANGVSLTSLITGQGTLITGQAALSTKVNTLPSAAQIADAVPTAAQIAAGVAGLSIEEGETLAQTLRMLRAVLAGNSAAPSSGPVVFYRKDGTTVALTISAGLTARTASTPGTL